MRRIFPNLDPGDPIAPVRSARVAGEAAVYSLMEAMRTGKAPQIDPEDAYCQSSTVYACLRLLKDSAAQVDWAVHRRERDGTIGNVIEDATRLFTKPNADQSADEFREQLVGWSLLRGDVYLYLDWLDGADARIPAPERPPREMQIVRPRSIETNQHPITGKVESYRVSDRLIHPSRVLHMADFDPHGRGLGTGPTETLSAKILLEIRAIEWNLEAFANGGAHRRPIFSYQHEVQPESMLQRAAEGIRKRFFGRGKAHKPIVVDKGMTVTELGSSLADMEYRELMQWLREEITSGLGVPKALIGHTETANRSDMETLYRVFWQDTLLPRLRRIEAFLTHALIRRYRPWADAALVFDLGGVQALQENLGEHVDLVSKLCSARIITPKQAREYLEAHGLTGIEGEVPGSDEILVPFNLMPIEMVSEPVEPEPPTTTEDMERSMRRVLRDERRTRIKMAHAREQLKLAREFEPQVVATLDKWETALVKALEDQSRSKRFTIIEATEAVELSRSAAHEEMKRRATLFHEKNVARRAEDVMAELDMDPLVDMTDPFIRKFIEDKPRILADSWTNTVSSRLKRGFADVAESGGSVQDYQRIVQATMGAEKYHGRALTVARTEATAAFNFGAEVGFIEAGIEEKEWLTAQDDAVRDSHVHLDGETVPVGKSFSNGADYPGDPRAEASEIINCRCTTTAVIRGA